MGNSSIKLKQVINTIVTKGIPDPRGNASGYGDGMVLDLATQVFADIATERFNWKWNRADAVPFLTNSWQQDYPQLAQPNGVIGWGEDCDAVDILNTKLPKPLRNLSWRRGLSRTSSLNGWWPNNICWMYNRDLFIGAWPGSGVTYSALTVSPQPQNPIMSMTDVNGNILIVTTPGVTLTDQNFGILAVTVTAAIGEVPALTTFQHNGKFALSAGLYVTFSGLTTLPEWNGQIITIYSATEFEMSFNQVLTPPSARQSETGVMAIQAGPPQLPPDSPEGLQVGDGSVVWTCVSPTSQGFRIDRLPPATGPTLLIKPYYQIDPPLFTAFTQTLDPMPDSFSRHFYRGLESELLIASPNPGDLKRGQNAKQEWMMALAAVMKQGDRELNLYSLVPAVPVVEQKWNEGRPYTADDPI